MSENNENNFGKFFETMLNNKNIQNMLTNLASQMGPHLINCDLIKQILDSHPNLTDETMTQHINSIKQKNSDIKDLIDKYLKPYQKQTSDKTVYQIRDFVQSSKCKEALADPDVRNSINEVINSSQFKEKFQELLSQYFNQQSSTTE